MEVHILTCQYCGMKDVPTINVFDNKKGAYYCACRDCIENKFDRHEKKVTLEMLYKEIMEIKGKLDDKHKQTGNGYGTYC